MVWQMKLTLLLCASLVWGQLSTRFFFRSWIAFLGIICCHIGFFRACTARWHILNLLFSKITETIFYGLLLFAGFYILYLRLDCGQTQLEILVYFISAMVQLFFVLPRISKEIDDIWRSVNGPEWYAMMSAEAWSEILSNSLMNSPWLWNQSFLI